MIQIHFVPRRKQSVDLTKLFSIVLILMVLRFSRCDKPMFVDNVYTNPCSLLIIRNTV